MDIIEARLAFNPAWRRFDFYLFGRPNKYMDVTHLAAPVVMEPIPEDDAAADIRPTFTLSEQAAQILMDELWSAGVRPSDYGAEGQIEAMKAHLEDMRRLVFEGVRK